MDLTVGDERRNRRIHKAHVIECGSEVLAQAEKPIRASCTLAHDRAQ